MSRAWPVIRSAGALAVLAWGALGAAACSWSEVSGELAGDATWDAAGSPYLVVGDVKVPAGVTLTIGPGTTVVFESGSGLTVEGTLRAEGTADRGIRLTHRWGTTAEWDGLRFVGTREDNRLVHVQMESASAADQAILIYNARLLIDHMTWRKIRTNVLELKGPQLTVRNSKFPGIARGEVIHGKTLGGNDWLIIEGNTFAASTSGDIIDFSGGKRPGPILQLLDNTFLGGQDDGLDLDGSDALVEGNRFFRFNAGRGVSGTANAVSASQGAQVMAVRNVFFENDHALLAKQGAFLRLEHNTIVGSKLSAVQLAEAGRDVEPGRGIEADGNIFWNNADTFSGAEAGSVLTVNRSIVPEALASLGRGNLSVDPMFVDQRGDFRLAAGSPAIGAGPHGLDIGAYVNGGAHLTVEALRGRSAILSVGGPGITHYWFRVNDLPYGPETARDRPIRLADLAPGDYKVRVRGKNFAGVWQDETRPTVSPSWTVKD